jgi:hypothetical protein
MSFIPEIDLATAGETMNYQTWVENQGRMAQALESGALGGAYADGAIILTSAIGAMSSLLWPPAKGTDKKRFIEIMVRFCSGGPDTTRISSALFAEAHPQLAQALGITDKALYMSGRNDKTEADVMAICTAAGSEGCQKTNVRRYAYATLLYEHVRCSFIHEYRPGDKATEVEQLRSIAGISKDEISYANTLFEQNNSLVSRRLVHFPLEWIKAVAVAVARTMDDQCSMANAHPLQNLGLAIPQSWWSEGG